MRRICGYFISILSLILCGLPQAKAQDTLWVPLKISAGVELIGPVTWFLDKQTLSTEAYVSADINEKTAVVLAGGYLDYEYSQYNYKYLSNGIFFRAGADFNLMKPKKSQGLYWAGIGLRYGISRYSWQVPTLHQNNYWGETFSSISPHSEWGHFLEASPGMRAALFPGLSIGWSVSLRMLIYTGYPKGLEPIYFPGFGNAGKRFATGFSYYLVWNIPYKKIRVITKKEEPEENEEEDQTNRNQNTTSPGFR